MTHVHGSVRTLRGASPRRLSGSLAPARDASLRQPGSSSVRTRAVGSVQLSKDSSYTHVTMGVTLVINSLLLFVVASLHHILQEGAALRLLRALHAYGWLVLSLFLLIVSSMEYNGCRDYAFLGKTARDSPIDEGRAVGFTPLAELSAYLAGTVFLSALVLVGTLLSHRQRYPIFLDATHGDGALASIKPAAYEPVVGTGLDDKLNDTGCGYA